METLSRYGRHLRAQGYSPNTIRVKTHTVAAVARAAQVEPEHLTADLVEQYLDRDLAPWSRRKYAEHLKAFAVWAGIPDPTEGMRFPRRPKGLPRPVSEPDLALLLAAATKRTRAFVMLGAFAGLRSCETARVRADDLVSPASGPALRVLGKGGRLDVVPIPAVLVRELTPWCETAGGGPLWPGVTATAVQQAVRTAGNQAGLVVTSHQLRHRYGSVLYAATRDILLVQRLMRHESPTTTAVYALLLDDVGARAVDQLPLPCAS